MSQTMREAGAMLSNCAFNLAQRKPGEPLTEADIRALDESRRAWDTALSASSSEQAQQGATAAAIEFAVTNSEGLAFLREWMHGEWDVIRREWPEAPPTVFAASRPAAASPTPPTGTSKEGGEAA